jgi:hypothetical protein
MKNIYMPGMEGNHGKAGDELVMSGAIKMDHFKNKEERS